MRGLFCSIMILFALLDVVTIKCKSSPIEIQGGKDKSIAIARLETGPKKLHWPKNILIIKIHNFSPIIIKLGQND